jgi:hypothetical protein
VLLAVLQEAAEEAESAPTAFYVAAAILVVFAAILSAVGTVRHETFPRSRGVAFGLMLVCAVLVAGTMLSAVFTS